MKYLEKNIKAWIEGLPVDEDALQQTRNLANMPFIHKWVALMPDYHLGKGATVGTVIATDKAIIPAAVGVDLGCGMLAFRTSLTAEDLPESLLDLRLEIESLVPVGDASHRETVYEDVSSTLAKHHKSVVSDKHPKLTTNRIGLQMGTLGGGNHFIELCLDENNNVWVMLHTGSRGVGNQIGRYFIEKAKQEMERFYINLPDKDLAYLPEGSVYFDDYVRAVGWAQRFAAENRVAIKQSVLKAMEKHLPPFTVTTEVVNCHHNYIERENHFGKNVYVTRKGAIRAGEGELGIIPASMGSKSFIVRGKGNKDSFCSCSHGSGRLHSRTEAKKLFTVEQLKKDLVGIECKQDESVLDESPRAYKDIDLVMKAQEDLVEIVHTLKQVMCIKG